jgi:hypothetical protein
MLVMAAVGPECTKITHGGRRPRVQTLTTGEGHTVTEEMVRFQPGQLGEFDENKHDWNTLMAEAVGVGGADLLDKDVIDYLVKVPHCVVGLDFRQGKALGNGHEGAYVSATAVIAPEDVLKKKFKGNDKASNVESLPFDAEDVVVYNDGSTGYYRQVVKLLHDNGYIGLPDPVIEGGGSGESTYDVHPSKWTGVDAKRVRVTTGDDGEFKGIHVNIRISAPRGIRYSEYNGPEGEARTRYIG